MRLVMIAGASGTGKTTLIVSILRNVDTERIGVITNNLRSEELLDGICTTRDYFPIKSPCARPRQFSFRLDRMLESGDLDLILTEPPGSCTDTAAPMLNPLTVFRKDAVQLGPLIVLVDGRTLLEKKISSDDTEGLKLLRQIDESDCIVIQKSDLYSDAERNSISLSVRDINPDCMILFVSVLENEGVDAVSDIVFSNDRYQRPLVN